MQRKSLYYVINLVLPSTMLSALVLLVFLLPPDCGEKISMGVTLLLSNSVFMLMISENVPNTSTAVPLIGEFAYGPRVTSGGAMDCLQPNQYWGCGYPTSVSIND